MKLIYSIHKYDVTMFTWVNGVAIRTSLMPVCRGVSRTADGLLYVLAAAWLYWDRGGQDGLLQAMVLAFLIERPVYFALKKGFKRNRPQQALSNFSSAIKPADQFSFPSGHTSAAFMVATLFGYCLPDLAAALYCWAAAVGFSRVVLGVHFPTDTLMGMVLGVGTAFFSLNYVLS